MSSVLPFVPYRPHTADEVDALARTAARAAFGGLVEPGAVRSYLTGLLVVSQVPVEVARERVAVHPTVHGPQAVDDLSRRLVDLLTAKITSGYIQLERIAEGSSFSGACRMLLRSKFGARSEMRNMTTAQSHETPASHQMVDFHHTFSEARRPDVEAESDTIAKVAASFADRAFTARPMAKVQLNGKTLAQVYGVPLMAKPRTAEDRQAVMDEIEAEPRAVYRVAAAMSRGEQVESPLAHLFTTYSPDDLEQLREIDPLVAYGLARAAVSAVPPVPQRVAARLREKFVALARNPKSRRLARLTVRAWLDAESTMIGDEYNGWQLKPDEQQAAEAGEFVYQATLLLKAGLPGFVTTDDVSHWLMVTSDEVAAELAATSFDAQLFRSGQPLDAESA